MQFNQLLADGQSQPGAPIFPCDGALDLLKWLKNLFLLVLGNPDAGIDDMDGEEVLGAAFRSLFGEDFNFAFMGEFNRVVNEI